MTEETTKSILTEVEEEEKWSLASVVESTSTFMRGLKLPRMERPEGMGEQYSFPTDMRQLTSDRLGQLQLQLTAFYTYLMGVVGEEEAKLGAMEEVFELKLGLAMAAEAARYHERKTPVKEILRASAIKGDASLDRLFKSIVSMRHRVKVVTTQSSIYHEQLVRLSREQSRREAGARLGA